MLAAGSLSSPYPIRQGGAGGSEGGAYSLPCSAASRRKLVRLFETCYTELTEKNQSPPLRGVGRVDSQQVVGAQINLEQIAQAFAAFARQSHTRSGLAVTPLHVEAAFALIHRRVEAIPRRLDRALICGLTAVAMADSGMKVHLVVDNALAIPWLEHWLVPICSALGLQVGQVLPGASEQARAAAYAEDITLVSARECAMDFLRDAARWPERSNPALARFDRITGKRSRLAKMLMQGLPCGVFMDIDGALIDQASSPVALTRDAHPMHETEELEQALEMVKHLERGRHYLLTEEGAEIALTDLGQRQLAAWAEQLGGSWAVPHLAGMMLGVAIVTTTLLASDKHYRVRRNRVEWLLEEALVPGMAYYGKAFLERVVELKEGCQAGGQRELVARASYQQVFNRYIHLCGCCHSLKMIGDELLDVYGLKGHSRGGIAESRGYDRVKLFATQEEKLDFLKAQLEMVPKQACYLLVATDDKTLAATSAALTDVPHIELDLAKLTGLRENLQAGRVLLGLSPALEYQVLSLSDKPSIPIIVVHLDRSPLISRDLRSRFWVQDSQLRAAEQWLLISGEDELFAEASSRGLQSVLKLLGPRIGGWLLARRVSAIHKRLARETMLARQGLVGQESTMHRLLTFSGRELYE